MEDYPLSVTEDSPNYKYFYNVSCRQENVPLSVEYMSGMGGFGSVFLSLGTILTLSTIALAIEACWQIYLQHESKKYKINCLMIFSVYPIASICSLIALAIPRTQLLTEGIIQISLTISMYRLYLMIIDIGRRGTTSTPKMLLKVGPCCCWPCLPFPSFDLNDTNLSWLHIIVLQFPIVQGILYTIFMIMHLENPVFYTRYNIFLQPLCVTSILLALYGVTIATMSLKDTDPDAKLRLKALVTQLVLFFSKLQGSIIKALPVTGLFPCNPPITPQIYANFTFNSLMLIEMLLLCYAARYMYQESTTKKSNEMTSELGMNTTHLKQRNDQGINNNNNNTSSNNNNNNGHVQT